jgi:hypothetical protein
MIISNLYALAPSAAHISLHSGQNSQQNGTKGKNFAHSWNIAGISIAEKPLGKEADSSRYPFI